VRRTQTGSLDTIAELLSAKEWEASTLDEVAEVVRPTAGASRTWNSERGSQFCRVRGSDRQEEPRSSSAAELLLDDD
jgi:hypothetical protein